MLSPNAIAQVVTSGLTGTVRGDDGKAAAGASVIAVHTPTNASFKAITNAEGRYSFRSLPAGGPYTVSTSVEGYGPVTVENVYTQMGTDALQDLTLKSEVLSLEKFTVTGEANTLDASQQGVSNLFTREQIELKPTTQRSFADLVSASPLITLRSLSGDREEAQITALGQNNRYNSIMIDGDRINDQFGLNATGLASFFNPIAVDTIGQFNAQPVTYDVRYSGFTGATVNFITKTGTNEFHGSAYYIFAGDHLAGIQMQGPDARTLVQSGNKVVPKLERPTYGFTLGGPIWKDHLWFFLNYEKFERIGAPNSAGLPGVNADDLAVINARVAQITKVDYGQLGGNANSIADEEKKLAKLTWQIIPGQTLTARYSTTEGQVPQFGSYTTTSSGTGLNVSPANIVGGAATAFDSHFYAQTREEKTISGQLVSQWTPDLSSEIKFSNVKQDQYTPVNEIAPEIDIYGVRGTNQAGQAVTNGVVVLGTERFRHGNQINVDTKNYSANVDYVRGNFTYSGGFDVEANDYYNLFRQMSYGIFNYASPAAFAADTPTSFQRNYTDLALKGDYADISQYTQTGIFAKVKWDPNSRLNIIAGLRYDMSSSDTRPVYNEAFFNTTGMRNDGTVDGATDISPRVGFNWAIDKERKTQLRGGFGYFVGRAPWVFWSNSYGSTGVGTFTSNVIPTGGLNGYLANSFDPANPMGTGTQTGTSRAEIALSQDEMNMPSLWRGNLGLDHKLAFLDSKITLEVVHSINENTIFITNDNLKARGIAADGRTYFFGNPSTAANALYPAYTNIYHIRNVKAGKATYEVISWERELKNNWGFSLSYTRGDSTEAQAAGQTTASGAWQRNAVFNQGEIETGTSDFEIKDRVQFTFTYRLRLLKDAPTTASLYYEGRSGSPYSFAYSNDMNGDGFAGNDLIAVPTDVNDARFDFSSLPTAQRDAMFAYLQSSGLSKYAGGYAPKNSFYQPWVNRLDLHLEQDIPLHVKSAKLNLFLDFTNFGNFISEDLFNYVERAPSTVNDVFERNTVGNATINTTTGKITPTTWAPNNWLIDNVMSRWRIQVGARLTF
jgi:hypothetical protein